MIFFIEYEGRIIGVKPYERGYYETNLKVADTLPPEVAESALAGSMFSWDAPCARLALDYMKEKANES